MRRFDGPDEPRLRKLSPQRLRRRKRVDHVAERTEFDDQNVLHRPSMVVVGTARPDGPQRQFCGGIILAARRSPQDRIAFSLIVSLLLPALLAHDDNGAMSSARLYATELRTRDWPRLVDWYRDVVGLKVAVRMTGERYALLVAADLRRGDGRANLFR